MPDSLTYSGNRVQFHYDGSALRQDIATLYVHGTAVTPRALLQSVEVFAQDNSRLRRYTLDYQTDSATHIKQLVKVSETGSNGISERHTRFTWHQNTPSSYRPAGDRGLTDHYMEDKDNDSVVQAQAVDMNGDGEQDILYLARHRYHGGDWSLYRFYQVLSQQGTLRKAPWA